MKFIFLICILCILCSFFVEAGGIEEFVKKPEYVGKVPEEYYERNAKGGGEFVLISAGCFAVATLTVVSLINMLKEEDQDVSQNIQLEPSHLNIGSGMNN